MRSRIGKLCGVSAEWHGTGASSVAGAMEAELRQHLREKWSATASKAVGRSAVKVL